MPTVGEASGAAGPMKGVLDAGIETLSSRQSITFTLYQKVTLSQDGFVFWVATPETMTALGSLHVATDRMQAEDETIGVNQAIFTSESPVTQFAAVSPNTMWIGTWAVGDGQTIQIAFSRRGSFFKEADLWHYSGFAVYPALSAQLVQSEADIPAGPIVSNSLPIWLLQDGYAPVYASFLVPDNVVPPYISAHIESTRPIGAFPVYQGPGSAVPNSGSAPLYNFSSSQLMRDEVRLTLYGFQNQSGLQFLSSLIDASLTTEAFGWANDAAVVDEIRVQPELAARAQKKTIHISANYYQGTADAFARRYILQVLQPSIAFSAPSTTGTAHLAIPRPTFAGSGT